MPPRSAPATPAFKVLRSAVAGRGAFAVRDIRKGERLIEYLGERISHADADARYIDAAMASHHTFLFAVSRQTVIDAFPFSVQSRSARLPMAACNATRS